MFGCPGIRFLGARVLTNSRYPSETSSDAINFSAMAQGDQIELISGKIELIDHSIIARPQTTLRTPLQTVMGIIRQSPPEFPDPDFEAILRCLGQFEENRIKLPRIDFRCLTHGRSVPANACLTGPQVRLTALDTGDEFRRKCLLIFKEVGQEVLQLQRFISGQLSYLSFKNFKMTHDGKLGAAKRGQQRF